MDEFPLLDAVGIFRTLERRGVLYVVIGALAGTLHGSPLRTNDADICPSFEFGNLERLAAALKDMRARVYTPAEPGGVGFACDAEALSNAVMWNLVTRFGRLDISFTPSGTRGYDDLARRAVIYEVDDVRIPTASLIDVIRSKEAAGREKDRSHLLTLRKMLERIEPRAGRRRTG
jgi:hypothetical protein